LYVRGTDNTFRLKNYYLKAETQEIERAKSSLIYHYSEFSNQRAIVERRARYLKMKHKKQFKEQYGAYIEWISQAGTH
jgi:hypothetical protein